MHADGHGWGRFDHKVTETPRRIPFKKKKLGDLVVKKSGFICVDRRLQFPGHFSRNALQ
jgi:hypothetical protein